MKPAGYCRCWWYLLIKFDHTIGGNAEISANRTTNQPSLLNGIN